MRSLTVRLPDQLATDIEIESRARNCAKSDVVRERLQRGASAAGPFQTRLNAIADLIGSVEGLPPDLSSRRKINLKAAGYGKKRPR